MILARVTGMGKNAICVVVYCQMRASNCQLVGVLKRHCSQHLEGIRMRIFLGRCVYG